MDTPDLYLIESEPQQACPRGSFVIHEGCVRYVKAERDSERYIVGCTDVDCRHAEWVDVGDVLPLTEEQLREVDNECYRLGEHLKMLRRMARHNSARRRT